MIKPNNEFGLTIPAGEEKKFLWRESWRLAWPVFIGQGVMTSMILLSRVMVGALSEGSLAALGIGQMIFFTIVMGLASISVGMVALIAREMGAGNTIEASRIFGQGVYFGTLVSIVLSIAGILLARPIFQLLNSPPEVIKEAVVFMKILFAGLVPASISFFLGAGLRGAGDTRTPMIIQVVNTLLNIFFLYLLVFGKWGLPKMGIEGASLAMVTGFSLALIMFILLFAFKLTIIPISFSGFALNWDIIKRIVKIGGPTAIEWELIQLGLIGFVSIVNHYGTEASASYIIGLTILNFSQLPAMGYNASVTTLVGMCLGAKKPDLAEIAVEINTRASLLIMSLLSILIFFFARPLITLLFPQSSEQTVELAKLYLQVIAICQPLMAMSFVQAGALRGAGYSVSPMIVQSLGMYLFRIGLAVLLWKEFSASVHWLWLTQIPDFLFRAVFLSASIKKGKWKMVKV